MHYDIFRSITRLQAVLLHAMHCNLQFPIFQYIIFLLTNLSSFLLYYTQLHLNDPLRRNFLGNSRILLRSNRNNR